MSKSDKYSSAKGDEDMEELTEKLAQDLRRNIRALSTCAILSGSHTFFQRNVSLSPNPALFTFFTRTLKYCPVYSSISYNLSPVMHPFINLLL